MADALIFDHLRTPRGRGKPDGALHQIPPAHLAAQILAALTQRNGLDGGENIDDVILGCVDPIGEAGGNIARAAIFAAGLNNDVPGVQINRFCASGLDAVNFGAAQIMAGQHHMVIAGGVESMSRIPIGASGGAWAVDPQIAVPSFFLPQGISADLIASKYALERPALDAFAVESHKRAANAWDKGYFAGSVMPVHDINGLILLERDEHLRPDTNLEALAALRPSFAMIGEMGGFNGVAVQAHPDVEKIYHRHHAGNSSGIVDGASGILIGSKAATSRLQRRPRARIKAFANIGSDPALMLTGPIDVTRKLLTHAKMTLADIDLIEINEAFASVVLRYCQELKLGLDRVNVNGGAIAMGHPLGATGAMILGTALDELERRDLNTALVTLCIGAGMGTATIIERV